jgi:ubiquinone/menaquinone biosynthesis C-methylase UbiE
VRFYPVKVRESGMPVEDIWQGFFAPEVFLDSLEIGYSVFDVAEFGCGYGTFTIPAARMISGRIYAIDIELDMVKTVSKKVRDQNIQNVVPVLRDFISDGTGLDDESVDYAMLFNILHDEKPGRIFKEAYRIVKPGGKIGIIHWVYEQNTPRGPPMEIRPKPEHLIELATEAGFRLERLCNLKPYHYGIVLSKA